jgi:hypothetical protein
MIKDKILFTSYTPYATPKQVTFENGSKEIVYGLGDILLVTPLSTNQITGALYIPSLINNLLSQSDLVHHGYSLSIAGGTTELQIQRHGQLLASAALQGG